MTLLAFCDSASANFSNIGYNQNNTRNNTNSEPTEDGAKYRGGFDVGYWGSSLRFDFETHHGCQINPYFFVGGGVGAHYFPADSYYVIPVFINTRISFVNSKTKIGPFLDIRLGYSLSDSGLILVTPTFGVHFNGFLLSISYELNISIGHECSIITLEDVLYYNQIMKDVNDYYSNDAYSNDYNDVYNRLNDYNTTINHYISGVMLKWGFEF